MHYVYRLIDYKGFAFYIGLTKNLKVRIHEHEMNKNATPAKRYRVRRSIEFYGYLKYVSESFETKAEAVAREAELIHRFRNQLVNKLFGTVKRENKQRRSKGKSVKCKHCLNYYRRIGRHKCKKI